MNASAGELAGRVALVTGAASGIGAAIVRRFRSAGAVVAALDVRPSPETDLNLLADLGSDEAVSAAYSRTVAAVGAPDIVVHAAAASTIGGCLDSDPAAYAEIYDVNVIGAVRLLRLAIPAMRAASGGSLVFLSSINADFATPTLAAYAASKAALNSLTRTAAVEFAPDNIRVNAIAPASIDTPLLRRSFDLLPNPAGARAENTLRHPIARLGTAEEVAELALFLASDRAGWISGAIFPIDGGASATRR